jgi:HTH-type transcriptional repressor of NAD biosynthesis genes
MSKYKTGFFGGKFFPFTFGHFHCLKQMSEECEQGVCIMFLNGKDETSYKGTWYDWLEQSKRIDQINDVCKSFPNIRFTTLYCDVIYKNGKVEEDNWDKETDFVKAVVGNEFDVVYSSEPSYDAYFKRAYPFAKHILVDPDRRVIPISSTKVRNGGHSVYLEWCPHR